MPKKISDSGKAVGLAIHTFGKNGEKFNSAELRATLPEISQQAINNRLRHFKDLGYVEAITYGLYRVPSDKLDSLWDYVTDVATKKKNNTMELRIVDLPDSLSIMLDSKLIPFYNLLAVASTEDGEEYTNALATKLFEFINVFYTMGKRINDFPTDDTSKLEYKRAKALLEEWMQ